MKIYEALYNGMTYESSACTIGIYTNEEDAKKAIEYHRSLVKKDHDEVYAEWANDPERDIPEFDTFKWWGVSEGQVYDSFNETQIDGQWAF